MDRYVPYWSGFEMIPESRHLNPRKEDGVWVKSTDAKALTKELEECKTEILNKVRIEIKARNGNFQEERDVDEMIDELLKEN